MIRTRVAMCFAAFTLVVSLPGCGQTATEQPETSSSSDESLGLPEEPGTPISGPTDYLVTPSSIGYAMGTRLVELWNPLVNPERPMGGIKLYRDVAPAVVVVRTDVGHGTGFLISDDGLLLTNHHVVSRSILDLDKLASYAFVHFGKLNDKGRMELREGPVTAYVLAADVERDLALLRLQEIPDDLKPLPTIPLSEAGPQPGQSCTMIGHPGTGVLWTIRTGLVAGIGRDPSDLVFRVLPRLAANQEQQDGSIEVMGSTEVVVSSCLANSGDSGGPLVNDAGELIAVTFAVPLPEMGQNVSYHVSLEEVRGFLNQANRAPIALLPNPWYLGPAVGFLRDDPQVLASGLGDRWTQFLLDLDKDTPLNLIENLAWRALIGDQSFEAEVAVHYGRNRATIFYDADNDGVFDQILIYATTARSADVRFHLDTTGQWVADRDVEVRFLDGSPLQEGRLRKALMRIVDRHELPGRETQ